MGMLNLLYLYERVSEFIYSYAGLSPTSFLVIAALMIFTYKMVSSLFVAVDDHKDKDKDKDKEKAVRDLTQVYEQDMSREPVQLGRVTQDQLRAYDGSDPNKPLLMAIKGQIYDVSRGRMFYGPSGPYAMFAGRDATRALALMSFDSDDLTGNTDGLSDAELEVLQDWELKFTEKYPKVGVLIQDHDVDDDDVAVAEKETESHQQMQKENADIAQQPVLESKKAV